jgi:hypothetical protein
MNLPDLYFNLYIVAIEMLDYGSYSESAYNRLVEQISLIGRQLSDTDLSTFNHKVLAYRKQQKENEDKINF